MTGAGGASAANSAIARRISAIRRGGIGSGVESAELLLDVMPVHLFHCGCFASGGGASSNGRDVSTCPAIVRRTTGMKRRGGQGGRGPPRRGLRRMARPAARVHYVAYRAPEAGGAETVPGVERGGAARRVRIESGNPGSHCSIRRRSNVTGQSPLARSPRCDTLGPWGSCSGQPGRAAARQACVYSPPTSTAPSTTGRNPPANSATTGAPQGLRQSPPAGLQHRPLACRHPRLDPLQRPARA